MVLATAIAKWFRQALGLIVAIPMILVAGVGLVAPASPAWAAPFGCLSNFYYSAGSTIRAVLPDGTEQSISTGSFIANTIAMTSTGELYSFTPAAGLLNHLYTVAADGTATDLGAVAGLPAVNTFGAVFTDGGDLLVASGQGRVYRVDIGALTATEVTTADTALRGDLVSVGGQIYGSGGNQASLQRLDLTTGAVTAIPISGAAGVFGYPALWSVGGHFYGSNSTNLYEFLDFETGTASRVLAKTTSAPGTDGASCMAAPSPFLDAVDDDFAGTAVSLANGGTAGNVLTNDTRDASAVNANDVTSSIADDDGLAGVAIAADGSLTVPAGSPAGTYDVAYEICRTDNTAICDTAVAKVTVASDTVDAVDDQFGKAGGNVLTNDTINGATVNSAGVTLSLTNDGGLTGAALAADGTLTVPQNKPPGSYALTYEMCQTGEPTNCDVATITVTIPDGDADKDGLPDSKEFALGSGVNDPDTDKDGLKDGTEYNGFTMAKQVLGCDRVKRTIGKVRTHLLKRDSDGDGINDKQEAFGITIYQRVITPNSSYILRVVSSHPVRTDTDGDGLKDKVEITGSAAGKFDFAQTDPANCHTDYGRRTDGYELARGKNPVVAGEA